MAVTGKRKLLTLDDRVVVLKRIDNGESCRSIAAAVNCGKIQISRIHNDRAAIMKEWESGARCDLKFFKILKQFILVQYIIVSHFDDFQYNVHLGTKFMYSCTR